MTESYCGKNCGNCLYQTDLHCPGCKTDAENAGASFCEAAQCCQRRYIDSCSACTHAGDCTIVKHREEIPQKRLSLLKHQAEQMDSFLREAPFFRKWLWPLFWLGILNIPISILQNQNVITVFPGLRVSVSALSLVISAVFFFLFWELSKKEDHYRITAFCNLALGFLGLASYLPLFQQTFLAVCLLLLALGLSFVCEYHEYAGHAAVLDGFDYALAEKWRSLWKGFLLTNLGLGISIFLLAIPVLGFLLFLASFLGVIVVRILKFVYLFQTISLFRTAPTVSS